jgi:WhiB family redox-sensing transcriptional regulator
MSLTPFPSATTRPAVPFPRHPGERLPCRGGSAELFFSEDPAEVEHAKSLCTGCPARVPCLDGALERREPWGVWGGQLLQAGVVIPRKRPRGRPRKDQAAAG